MPYSLVFDLDGTISDPSLGIWRSVNYALQAFDYPDVPRETVADLIGPPIDRTFTRLTGTRSNSEIHALVAKFRERYSDIGYAENVLYPEIRNILERLTNRGNSMGVCTGKRVDFAERILERFEIRQLFSFVDGGDVGISKQQQLTSLRASGVLGEGCMIGDRASDIEAAQPLGMQTIGVAWGFGSRIELACADTIMDRPTELLGIEGAAVED